MVNRKAFVPPLKVLYPSLNLVYLLFFGLLALDLYSSIEISSNLVRNIICYYLVWLALPLCIINWLREKVWARPLWMILPIMGGVFTLQPSNFFRGFDKWKTQTIEYRHYENSKRYIAFQMLDIGLSRKRRKVEIRYLGPLFVKVKPASLNYESSTDWIEVNEDINEMGLKGG